tara:strand:+ start:63 stop:542 length:480 start_codon:yes stop_codon:yes gene_type:complete
MRVIILLVSFFSYGDQLKPISEALNDLNQILEGSSENEILKQGSILVTTKCGGASLLMSDEKGDFWDKIANGFLRLSILAEINDDQDIDAYTEDVKKLNSKYVEIIYAKRDEYSRLVRDIDPKDYIGEPPPFALLNADLDYCLTFTDTELWKEVNFDQI